MGPAGPVGGSDGQIIYNSGGNAVGSPNLTFNGTTLSTVTIDLSAQLTSSSNPNALTYVTYTGPPSLSSLFCGHTPFSSYGIIRVDSYWGNDINAATMKYQIPFKTVYVALQQASAGDTVFVNPGTYVETLALVLPAGVSLRGASVQTVAINYTGTGSETMITISGAGRIEDVTLNAFDCLSCITITNPLTFKLRTAVINISGTTAYGIYCSATGSTTVNSVSTIRGTTINATGSTTGYGIYLHGDSRLSLRDTVVFASHIGAICDVSGSFLDLKTSTISGTTADISQTYGTIIVTSTDLVHSNANGYGLTVGIYPNVMVYSIYGDIKTTTKHWLYPGAVTFGDLPTTAFGFSVTQKCLIHDLTIRARVAPGGGYTTTITVKNANTSAFLSIGLTDTEVYKQMDDASFTVNIGDIVEIDIVSTNNAINTTDVIFTFIMY